MQYMSDINLCLYFQILSILYSRALCNILPGAIWLMQDRNLTTLTQYLWATLHILSSSSPHLDRAWSFGHHVVLEKIMVVKCHRTRTDNEEEMFANN